jgi:hypothetical protein
MDWVNEQWAMIASWGVNVGTLGVVFWNTFVASRLGAKRVDRLLDFTSVAHKTFSNVKVDIEKALLILDEKVINKYVKPLVQMVNAEKQEKLEWQNLAITAISLANVPLNMKQDIYAFAKKATQISQETISLMEKSILNDIAKQELLQESNQTLEEDLKGV